MDLLAKFNYYKIKTDCLLLTKAFPRTVKKNDKSMKEGCTV